MASSSGNLSYEKLPCSITAEEAFRWLVKEFSIPSNTEDPECRAIAKLLLTSLLEIPLHKWFLQKDDYLLTDSQIALVVEAKSRLLQGEPVQYILGQASFGSHVIRVAPGVLIPRPETEELCHLVAKEWAGRYPKILDLGAGSGAISLYLTDALPASFCYALELSPQALPILKKNTENADPHSQKIKVLAGDFTSPSSFVYKLPPLDIVISNPPYVMESEKKEMATQVLDHEPHTALFAPDGDPLFFYKAILRLLPHLSLRPGARLYLEINAKLAEQTKDLLLRHPLLSSVELRNDMAGKPRFLLANIVVQHN